MPQSATEYQAERAELADMQNHATEPADIAAARKLEDEIDERQAAGVKYLGEKAMPELEKRDGVVRDSENMTPYKNGRRA